MAIQLMDSGIYFINTIYSNDDEQVFTLSATAHNVWFINTHSHIGKISIDMVWYNSRKIVEASMLR